MASQMVSEVGLCDGKCDHTFCNTQKKFAETLCYHCGKKTGYGREYYVRVFNSSPQQIHASCLKKDGE